MVAKAIETLLLIPPDRLEILSSKLSTRLTLFISAMAYCLTSMFFRPFISQIILTWSKIVNSAQRISN